MNRSDAAREVKSRYAEYLQPAKKRIAGKTTYICPICQNGTGKDGDGMSIDTRWILIYDLKVEKIKKAK